MTSTPVSTSVTPSDAEPGDSSGEPTPTPHVPPALGRSFWIVWTGQTVSMIGTSVSATAVAVYVYLTTGSVAWLGALSAVAAAPAVLVLPVLGRVDRWSRRTVVITADAVAGVCACAALVLARAGALQVWHLVVLAFVGGVANAIQGPAYQAAIAVLAPAEALGRANGLAQLGPALGMVLGPAIGAYLVARHGVEGPLWIDVATFLVAVAATAAVRFGVEGRADRADQEIGWAPVRAFLSGRGRPLVTLILAIAGVNFVLGAYNVVVTAFGVELGGASRVGLITGAGGATMILASIVVGVRGVPNDQPRQLVIGLVVMGAATIIAAIVGSFGVLLVAVAVSLGCVPFVNAVTSTVFHERVPPALHGRVFGLRAGLGQSLLPLGSVLAGVVTSEVLAPVTGEGEPASAMALVGIGAFLLVLSFWLASRRLDLSDVRGTSEP